MLKDFSNDIIDLYLNKKLSTSQIAKKYNCKKSSVYRILKLNGVKLRTISESQRKYDIGQSFFDVIDTEEKAYVLGFLYADGTNNPIKGRFQIGLAIYDRDILEKIRIALKSNAPLKIKKGYNIKGSNYVGSPTATLYINNKKLSQKLNDLGVIHNKTYVLEFPDFIPDNLLRHFIRGYFDGDGSCTIGKRNKMKVSIASTKNFLEGIKKVCESKNWTVHIYSKKGVNSAIGIFEICGKDSVKGFLDWIYKDAMIFSKRKYDRYYSYYYENKPLEKCKKLTNEELMSLYGYEDIIPIYEDTQIKNNV